MRVVNGAALTARRGLRAVGSAPIDRHHEVPDAIGIDQGFSLSVLRSSVQQAVIEGMAKAQGLGGQIEELEKSNQELTDEWAAVEAEKTILQNRITELEEAHRAEVADLKQRIDTNDRIIISQAQRIGALEQIVQDPGESDAATLADKALANKKTKEMLDYELMRSTLTAVFNWARDVGQCKITDMPRSAEGDQKGQSLWRFVCGNHSKAVMSALAPASSILPFGAFLKSH